MAEDDGQLWAELTLAGVQAFRQALGTVSPGTRHSVAFRWLPNVGFAWSLDGGAAQTAGGDGDLPPYSAILAIGSRLDGGDPLGGYIARLAAWSEALPHDRMQALTA